LRSRVFLRRGALGRRLAEGANPSSSPELERRSQQLLSANNRRALAQAIERVIDAAEERPSPYSSAVPLRRAAILEQRPILLSLAAELRDTDQHVSVRGVALIERLLTDGGSPLYVETTEESLEGALRHARSALLLG
jgi:hypothetical protein